MPDWVIPVAALIYAGVFGLGIILALWPYRD